MDIHANHAAAVRGEKARSLTVNEVKLFVEKLAESYDVLDLRYAGPGGEERTTRVPADAIRQQMTTILTCKGLEGFPSTMESLKETATPLRAYIAQYGGYGFANEDSSKAATAVFDKATQEIEQGRGKGF